MFDKVAESRARYGGRWTSEKLNILETYLNAYTTALKNQPFQLMYIDAFAGSGYVERQQSDPDDTAFMRGSAMRALDICDKQFDMLIFVEKDQGRCNELERLRVGRHDRNITVVNADANTFLHDLRQDWGRWRGVLFLDPSPPKWRGLLSKG